jgi:hypothetical protein
MLAADLHRAPDAERRLKLMMKEWGFRLPTASAILAVLYPKEFTVYDFRVCNALGDFDRLGGRRWSQNLWDEYRRFTAAVRSKARRAAKRWPPPID